MIRWVARTKGKPMSKKHIYYAYFEWWDGFMDGVLYPANSESFDMDFQCNDPILGGEGSDHVLEPFTEYEARKALALLLDCEAEEIEFDYSGAEPNVVFFVE